MDNVVATSGDSVTPISPFPGQTIQTVPLSSIDDVKVAVAQARAASEKWAKTSIEDRIKIFDRYYELLFENQELLQEYIERLQNLNENRNLINQRIESQLNEQIEINNNFILEIEESIPEQSENILGLNTLNQQKVQLYLLNIEYSEKILNNMIQSDLTRIEEINGMINAMTRSNSSLVDVFTEEVQGELETLQIKINENERNLANLNRDKRKLRQELENLQVEFESLIEERIRQEEEMRRLSLMDSRKRYMDEGESSSLKKSRY